MTHLKKRTLISVLLCVFALAVGIFFASYNITSALSTESLIAAKDNITVTYEATGPVDGTKKGIKLTNSTAGQKGSVTISNIKGPFDLKYRPYSDPSTTDVNDFERLIFDFVNKVDPAESFSVKIEQSGSGTYLPVWYKSIKNEQVLFHYAPGQTSSANLTPLQNPNVSFANRASGGYGDISRIVFDPYTMELSHYKNNAKTVMVDFDDPAAMKKNYASYHTIPDISQYDVVITLSPKSGKTCNVMLYELNGESLGGATIAGTASGPALDTRINMPTGVVGKEYKFDLESYRMYDLVDGYVKFDGTIRVIASGASYGNIEGDSFMPTVAGKHIIKFTPKDASGKAGTAVNFEIQVLAEMPADDWEFDYAVSDQLVINNSVKLPGARFYSPLAGKYDGALSVSATIKGANGQAYKTIDDASAPFTVDFEGNNVITVEYTSIDYIGCPHIETFVINNNGNTLTVPKFDNTYVVGSYLYADNVAGATHTVTSPSGKISSYEKILIDEVGVWEIEYNYQGGTYVQYAQGVETVASLWETRLGLTVLDEIGETAAYSRTYKTGSIMNSSTPYSQAQYKNIINVSDYTKDDILLEWFTVPKVMGSNEFNQITIYLDDLNDPSKSIKLEHYLYPYYYYEIMPTRVTVDGTVVEEYAALYHTTFFGEWTKSGDEPSQYNNTPVKISFDYNNRDLIISNDYSTQIVPLDDPNTIGIGNEWTGFTNDELRLTIEFSIITGEANLMVRTIDNLSLTKEVISDNVAPRINIDYDASNAPVAIVGDAQHPFPIMPAYAVDAVDGIISDVEYSVKFLKDGRVYDFPVNADGTILPTEAGTLRITYTATDLSGNIGTKTVEIQAVNSVDPLDIDIDYLALYPKEISVGEKIVVYPASGIGGSGFVDVEILAFDGEEEIEIDDVYIRPQAVTDDLKIVYRLTDYLGQTRDIEIPIKVVVKEGAVFSSYIVPPAVMANKPFTIPVVTAKQYNADGTSVDLDVTVLINGTVYNDSVYTTPNEAGTFTLQYKTDAGSSEVYTVEVHSVKKGAGYFVPFFYMTDGVAINQNPTVTEDDKKDLYNRLIFNVDADSSIFFINPQSSLKTTVEFTLKNETNRIGKINFRYVNVENPEEQILLTVEKNPKGLTTGLVTVNNRSVYTLPGNMTTVYDQGISLGFNGNKLIGDGGQVLGLIEETVDGAKFNGFTGSKVYLIIEFVDVAAASEFRFISINKTQSFSMGGVNDYKAPSLIMDRDIVTSEYGKKYTLPTMRIEDVLDSVVTGSMTITAPSGAKVKEITNIEEFSGYEFIPSEYGAYKIVIRCADTNGNRVEITENLRILDTNDIQIITQSAVPEVVKKGSQITLPGLVNIPNDAQVFIYLLSPDGNMIVPGSNKVFTASEYGNYKLFYTVTSASGVVSVQTYTIKVR